MDTKVDETKPWHPFAIGQRVEMTKDGIEQGLHTRGRTGVVTHLHPLAPDYIKVRRDGLKGTTMYHVKFWQPES